MKRPLRFVPFLRPMVWGGRRLADVLGKPLPSGDLYGESWEISDHPLHQSRVATGPLAGRTLSELLGADPVSILGAQAAGHPAFPWLIKFLDANDWLSVQVHPNDQAAQRLWPTERGKTEAWFVLWAAPGSQIYAGLQPGVDEPRLRRALECGTVTECLHRFEPSPGDCVFLPAGTVHAVGGGVLIAEVQQTSDATFRLYDWKRLDALGRPRALHVEPGLACISWSRGPVEPLACAAYRTPEAGASVQVELVRCAYFWLDYIGGKGSMCLPHSGRLRVSMILEGKGTLQQDGACEAVRAGQTWLLPAASGEVSCQSRSGVKALLCTLPPEVVETGSDFGRKDSACAS